MKRAIFLLALIAIGISQASAQFTTGGGSGVTPYINAAAALATMSTIGSM